MGVRVAYGKKDNIQGAIDKGTIPKGSLIITKDTTDSELFFYDSEGNLKSIEEKTRFETMTEAEQWIKKYPCKGYIFTIQNGAEWLPYVVNEDNTLKPITGETLTDITDVKRIDGNALDN